MVSLVWRGIAGITFGGLRERSRREVQRVRTAALLHFRRCGSAGTGSGGTHDRPRRLYRHGAPNAHLSRMCFAFFIATGSFFFGQAKLFPAEVRESGLLAIPALLPFALLLFWVIRIRMLPLIKKTWTPRFVRQAS